MFKETLIDLIKSIIKNRLSSLNIKFDICNYEVSNWRTDHKNATLIIIRILYKGSIYTDRQMDIYLSDSCIKILIKGAFGSTFGGYHCPEYHYLEYDELSETAFNRFLHITCYGKACKNA